MMSLTFYVIFHQKNIILNSITIEAVRQISVYTFVTYRNMNGQTATERRKPRFIRTISTSYRLLHGVQRVRYEVLFEMN